MIVSQRFAFPKLLPTTDLNSIFDLNLV